MKTERVRKERFCQNSTISAVWFGERLESQGTMSTDRLFTGQRLDSTGLYYYGARYYDPGIGRFLSPDSVSPNLMDPQSLNRYSYAFNNPLRYNDPSGNWPSWDDIKGAVNHTIVVISEGLQVAESKVVEFTQTAMYKANEINQTIDRSTENVRQTIDNTVGRIASAAGVEGTSTINTLFAQDVPVIDVREGSLLDNGLFFTNVAVTLYPIGVFTNNPMPLDVQQHEGFHWQDQESSGPFLIGWYADYIFEYVFYWAAYGGDADNAHEAVSYEQEANDHAGTGYDPPPFWEDWW